MRHPATELDRLYREAAIQTARGSKSFYFASKFFPPEMARAAHAIYWFCRFTDDLVDECATIESGRKELDEWALALRAAVQCGRIPAHPVLQVFLATVRNCDIPIEYGFELIEGMRMDLNHVPYRTFDELKLFCYRVACVVGLMMCHVIGFEGKSSATRATAHAIDLGIAMQLTNILRDIGEDLERARIYLPADELTRFGYSVEDLRRGVRNDAFRQLMRFQVERARLYYSRGNEGVSLLSSRGRFAVKVASDVYREILVRIEASDFDVFKRRAVVPARRKYWLMARALAVPIALGSARRLASWTV